MEEIKIGDKTYKKSDMYKLTDAQFYSIFRYTNSIERELLDKILDGTDTPEDIKKMGFIQSINKELQEIEFERNRIAIRNILDKVNIPQENQVDENDFTYTDIVNGINEAYSKVQIELEEQARQKAEEEEKALNAYSSGNEMEREKVGKAGIAKFSMVELFRNVSKEFKRNLGIVNSKYQPQHLVEAEKKKGFFARILDKINPKRVQKAKKERVDNVSNSIGSALATAKRKLKAAGAIALALVPMIGGMTAQAKEGEPKVEENIQNIQEVNFEALSNVADIAEFAVRAGKLVGNNISVDIQKIAEVTEEVYKHTAALSQSQEEVVEETTRTTVVEAPMVELTDEAIENHTIEPKGYFEMADRYLNVTLTPEDYQLIDQMREYGLFDYGEIDEIMNNPEISAEDKKAHLITRLRKGFAGLDLLGYEIPTGSTAETRAEESSVAPETIEINEETAPAQDTTVSETNVAAQEETTRTTVVEAPMVELTDEAIENHTIEPKGYFEMADRYINGTLTPEDYQLIDQMIEYGLFDYGEIDEIMNNPDITDEDKRTHLITRLRKGFAGLDLLGYEIPTGSTEEARTEDTVVISEESTGTVTSDLNGTTHEETAPAQDATVSEINVAAQEETTENAIEEVAEETTGTIVVEAPMVELTDEAIENHTINPKGYFEMADRYLNGTLTPEDYQLIDQMREYGLFDYGEIDEIMNNPDITDEDKKAHLITRLRKGFSGLDLLGYEISTGSSTDNKTVEEDDLDR